jgi:sugar phosphate isomerase/epimerase
MPRLSISNLAWPDDADQEALDLITSLGFDGIEIAPRRVLGDLREVKAEQIGTYRGQLVNRGLAVSALQGVLFGASGVQLFVSETTRFAMANSLKEIARLGGALGASCCVFGAPALRDPGSLAPSATFAIASEFFQDIAPQFASEGLQLCFEAVPVAYGSRFVTATEEAYALVEHVDTFGFALLVDTATMFVNGEDPGIIEQFASRIGHVHVSEPNFVPVGTSRVDHQLIAKALATMRYDGWITVEMKASKNWQEAIQQAHGFVSRCYAIGAVPK